MPQTIPQKESRQKVYYTGIVFALILLLALFLRTRYLTQVTYLFDESFSLKMTEFSWIELWQRVSQDTHPPLSFILLKLWGLLFGKSMLASRLFSVTFGILTIAGMFLFIKEAYSTRDELCSDKQNNMPLTAALLTAAFIALNPLQASWSMIARMYSLGTCLAAFSSWFLMCALHQKAPGGQNWILFTLTATALAYTHHFGLFIVTAQYFFATGYLWFQSPTSKYQDRILQLKPVFLSAVFFFWMWQPVLISFLDQSQRVDKLFYTRDIQLKDVGYTFYRLLIGEHWSPNMTLAGLAIAQLVFLGLLVLLLGRCSADLYIFLVVTITFLMAVLYSVTSRNIFKPRYFLYVQLFIFAAAAVLISRIPNKFLKYSVMTSALGGLALCSFWNDQLRLAKSQLPGMHAAISHFDNKSKNSAPLIVCNPLLYTTVITCTSNRDRVFNYSRDKGQEFPYFQGSSVMLDSDYISNPKIDKSYTEWIWTLDENRWLKIKVPISHQWKLVKEQSFPDYYCEPVLRLYERILPPKDQR
ncbi:hypothetical protein Pan241w_43740 [Gimesia alba]|uniref:Glycosyltransferase RgtA/B/C/D-like domain-containing protein n=1 Tax=Gimesia alba TaxID=2527973 RepID=A0A517RK60_9PLAN|nr:hypothetical protein [Gimesia alba]QDT44266.1 hypothetical protein Pan241w_43740 [Gimesia alba]